MNIYIIATEKIWNINNYYKYFSDDERLALVKYEMNFETEVRTLTPRMIFFPHWNHIIPKEIYEKFECVMFHAGDLPRGIGKEPFQWLIETGYTETILTVFRCNGEIDSGPVYNKIPFSLNGSAEECYKRCSDIIFKEIQSMIMQADKGVTFSSKVQVGEPTQCGNPTPEILLDAIDDLDELANKIRAWDSESYPKAYFDVDEFNFEFSNVIRRHDCIEAIVKIRMNDE